ncbi:hypothetical protein OPQ81_004761 [Rhizoctonia solani]|nr:hypothetical protein OPQ81_004761 [Rhizoctonia solani]
MATDMPVCLVRGSINMVPHIVNPGETISSTEYSQRPGGKGANQAVAVAASGSRVEFAGSVGSDGAWLKDFLQERGIGTDLMLIHEGVPSGRAIIQTTPDGENAIFLFPGTNYASYPTDAPALRPYHTHLLLQNEILLSDTLETLRAAHQQGVVSIFNPSPMLTPEELRLFPWEKLSVLVVNQGEARTLLNAIANRDEKLADSDGKTILVAQSRVSRPPTGREIIQLPAAKVKVTDTTGAGDTFLGYLCGSLMRIPGKVWDVKQLTEALKRSIVAASLSTERPGAMSSIPSNLEVESRLSAYVN